jgi:hypothetical protein
MEQTIDENRQIIPNTSRTYDELYRTFSLDQRRFIAYRMGTNSDVDAARQANIPITAVKQWRNKKLIDQALIMLADNAVQHVQEMRYTLLGKALTVIGDALESKDERIRLQAAQDIQDRGEGKAMIKVAPVMPNGVDAYQPDSPDAMDRTLARWTLQP